MHARRLRLAELLPAGELLVLQRIEVHQPLDDRRQRQHDDADADRRPAERPVDVERPSLVISPPWPPVASPILPATKLPTAVM